MLTAPPPAPVIDPYRREDHVDKPFFDAPGNLTDFNAIPGQGAQWSAAVSGWIDGNIELIVNNELHEGDPSQFYNESKPDHPAGTPIDQVIGWNALPGTLRNRWGRDFALDLAEQLMPLTRRMDGPGSYYVGELWEGLFYRPQDEYCEWHVTRDTQGRIVRVTFSSEPPEYWQALHGDTLPDVNNVPAYDFTGDKKLLCELYREYVSPEVELEDLECHEDLWDYTDPREPVLVYPKGAYNPYNRWNTTAGVMHLTHPANSLSAEINLGVRATVLHVDPSDGRQIIDPEALICCARYGGPNRCSDPTIGSTVNALASLGAHITLRNPIGLAMNHLDLSGFTTPRGEPVDESFFTIVRGEPQLIERAVFEVPAGEGYTVSDLQIAGVPITRGSQIAEHIVVSIVGRAVGIGDVHNTPVPGGYACCQADAQGNYLVFRSPTPGAGCSPTGRAAFDYPPATPAGEVPAAVAQAVAPVPASPAIHRHRTRVV